MASQGVDDLINTYSNVAGDTSGSMSALEAVRGAGTVLGLLGAGAIAYDIGESIGMAINQEAAGNDESAARITASLAGRILGGLEGAEGLTAIGGESGFLLAGPVGAAIGGFLGGALGWLGGSAAGKAAATGLFDAASSALGMLAGWLGPNGPLGGVVTSLGDYVNPVAGLFGYGMVDPIVLDLSGNGVQLTSLQNSNAFFDLYGTGFAVNTGWVGPQTALLVQAPAGGGPINSITDLFGSQSTDGFTALAALDTNHDGLIDARDPGFASLQLWTDTNGNGGVDPGELQTLAQLGVVSIGLSATVVDQSANGNEIQRIATFTRSDGTTGEVAEVSLNNSRVDTQYTGAYQLNPAVLTLPNLRGYGTLPDLFIAASQDSVLLGLLQTLASQDLSSAVSLPGEVRAIMYRWAGVDGVAPDSRGAFVDAQDLGFLEKFLGQTFGSGVGDGANPANGHQGQSLEAAFNQVFSAIETRLLAQGPLAGLLPNVRSAQPPLRWAA